MKNLMQLKEEYPNTFKGWMNERDIIKVLDSKWTSRESWYLMKNGIGTQNVSEADVKDGECQGYFNVRVEGDDLKIYLDITLRDWDDEEKQYITESSVIIGWN